MATYYTLKDIENIKFNGFNYTLPLSLLSLIKKIESELQITDFVEKKENNQDERKNIQNRNIKKMDHSYNRNNRNSKTIFNDDWESIRNFKSTKIDKKEGIDKTINNIRILLNKISIKNYEIQKNTIIESIDEFFNSIGVDNNLVDEASSATPSLLHIEKLTHAIFDIVSTNKFFSEIYANLYNELIKKFVIFKDILVKYIETYKETIEHIHYIDSNIDYDGYCLYIKKNDNRKAMTLFIFNMYKTGVLEEDIIINLLQYFLDKSLEYIDISNRTNELEEITENLYIITSNIHSLLNNNEKWKTNILPVIISISQMKTKEHESLSNRVLFKYMDIIDSMDG